METFMKEIFTMEKGMASEFINSKIIFLFYKLINKSANEDRYEGQWDMGN